MEITQKNTTEMEIMKVAETEDRMSPSFCIDSLTSEYIPPSVYYNMLKFWSDSLLKLSESRQE